MTLNRKYIIFQLFVALCLMEFNLPLLASADKEVEIPLLIQKFKSLLKDRNEAMNKITTYGDEAIPILVGALSHSPNSGSSAEIAFGVVRTLEQIGSPRAIETLGTLVLEHTYMGVTTRDSAVKRAIYALEKMGPEGENQLIRALANKDNQIQFWLAEALTRKGDTVAIKGLISALPNIHAAKALGKIKSPRAVEALVSTLPLHYSIVALGEIKDPRSIVPLMRELNKKPNEVNTEFLFMSNLPPNTTIKEKQDLSKNIPFITSLNNSKNRAVEEALSELDVPLIPRLYEIAAEIPTNIDLVQQQTEFADRLISLLVSKNIKDRFIAEFAIVRVARTIEPSIIKALNSSNNEHLRKEVAGQMGKMQGQKIENALVNALADKNPLVVAYAARSLGELRSQSAIEPLKKVALTGSLFERRGAVWAISRIGSPIEKTLLKDICNDKDEYVRRNARCSSLDGT